MLVRRCRLVVAVVSQQLRKRVRVAGSGAAPNTRSVSDGLVLAPVRPYSSHPTSSTPYPSTSSPSTPSSSAAAAQFDAYLQQLIASQAHSQQHHQHHQHHQQDTDMCMDTTALLFLAGRPDVGRLSPEQVVAVYRALVAGAFTPSHAHYECLLMHLLRDHVDATPHAYSQPVVSHARTRPRPAAAIPPRCRDIANMLLDDMAALGLQPTPVTNAFALLLRTSTTPPPSKQDILETLNSMIQQSQTPSSPQITSSSPSVTKSSKSTPKSLKSKPQRHQQPVLTTWGTTHLLHTLLQTPHPAIGSPNTTITFPYSSSNNTQRQPPISKRTLWHLYSALKQDPPSETHLSYFIHLAQDSFSLSKLTQKLLMMHSSSHASTTTTSAMSPPVPPTRKKNKVSTRLGLKALLHAMGETGTHDMRKVLERYKRWIWTEGIVDTRIRTLFMRGDTDASLAVLWGALERGIRIGHEGVRWGVEGIVVMGGRAEVLKRLERAVLQDLMEGLNYSSNSINSNSGDDSSTGVENGVGPGSWEWIMKGYVELGMFEDVERCWEILVGGLIPRWKEMEVYGFNKDSSHGNMDAHVKGNTVVLGEMVIASILESWAYMKNDQAIREFFAEWMFSEAALTWYYGKGRPIHSFTAPGNEKNDHSSHSTSTLDSKIVTTKEDVDTLDIKNSDTQNEITERNDVGGPYDAFYKNIITGWIEADGDETILAQLLQSIREQEAGHLIFKPQTRATNDHKYLYS